MGRVANPAVRRRRASSAPLSRFVRGGKSEAVSQQLVLLADGPRAGKAEALAQPQHRLEAGDRTPGCVERAEAADPRYRSLDPEVVALDALLQVLSDVADRRSWQQARLAAVGDGGWVGTSAIGADAIQGEQRLILEHLAEEALGGVEIAVGGEQEVDRLAMLIDGAVEVAPLAADLDVGLIDPHRAAVWPTELPHPLLDQGRVGQHPPVQGGVIHLQAAFQEQLLDVAIAERVAQVPRDRLDDQGRLVVPASEVSLSLLLELGGDSGQDHGPAPKAERHAGRVWLTSRKRRAVRVCNKPVLMPRRAADQSIWRRAAKGIAVSKLQGYNRIALALCQQTCKKIAGWSQV